MDHIMQTTGGNRASDDSKEGFVHRSGRHIGAQPRSDGSERQASIFDWLFHYLPRSGQETYDQKER